MFHHILLFIQVLLRFFPCSLNTSSSPSALDEVAFSTSRNENQKHAQSFSSKNVMTKIIQAMSQFIPKRLHLQTIRYFVHKPLFILIQSLTPFECKVNFNQLLQSYMSHMYKNFTGKSSQQCALRKIIYKSHFHALSWAPVLNKTLFALSAECNFSSIFSSLFQFVHSFLILVFS